jgi:hypothetical protein
MTHEEYLKRIRAHGAELRKDPVKLREFMKSIGAFKKRRSLQGEELERVLTMLRLMGPGEQSNNQHVWTESWRVGNIEYNLHSGENFEELEEVIDDE